MTYGPCGDPIPPMRSVIEPGHAMATQDAIDDVLTELYAAIQKFGDFASPHEGWAVIHEEEQELWDEVRLKTGTPEKRYNEACQVAAMALRFMITFGNK